MDMALHDNFRERIRRRRQELGLTQRAVAERMGVTPAFVTQAELGMNIPRLDTVERFAQALNCSSLELYYRSRRPASRPLPPPKLTGNEVFA
jgi:transcriptional regulator with XRE-family HTH domain